MLVHGVYKLSEKYKMQGSVGISFAELVSVGKRGADFSDSFASQGQVLHLINALEVLIFFLIPTPPCTKTYF